MAGKFCSRTEVLQNTGTHTDQKQRLKHKDYYGLLLCLLLKHLVGFLSSEEGMVDMYCFCVEYAHYNVCDLVLKCDLLAAVSAL